MHILLVLTTTAQERCFLWEISDLRPKPAGCHFGRNVNPPRFPEAKRTAVPGLASTQMDDLRCSVKLDAEFEAKL